MNEERTAVDVELELREARKEIAQLKGQRTLYCRLVRTKLLTEMKAYAALIANEAASNAVTEDAGHRMATGIQLFVSSDQAPTQTQVEDLRRYAAAYYRTSGSWPAEGGIARRVRAELDGLLDVLLSDAPVPEDPEPAPARPGPRSIHSSRRRAADQAALVSV